MCGSGRDRWEWSSNEVVVTGYFKHGIRKKHERSPERHKRRREIVVRFLHNERAEGVDEVSSDIGLTIGKGSSFERTCLDIRRRDLEVQIGKDEVISGIFR